MHSFDMGNAADNSIGVNMFTPYGETLCNDLYVDGAVIAYKDIVAADNLVAADGHVYSPTGCAVGKLTADSKTSVDTAWNAGHSYELSLINWANAQFVIDFRQMWYAYGRPGNDDTIHSEWVSLRNDSDYKCSAFTLYESRWAQLARSGSGGGYITWVENAVETNWPDGKTHPFPGTIRLTMSSDTYKKHSFKLYDSSDQRAKDRATTSTTSDYESPVTLNTPLYSVLNGNYPIIGK